MKGEVPSSLPSTGEVTSGVLCPVLSSPVQERYGHTGKRAAKSHKYVKDLEHLSYEERLRKLELLSL